MSQPDNTSQRSYLEEYNSKLIKQQFPDFNPKIAILLSGGMDVYNLTVDRLYYYDEFLSFPRIAVPGHIGTLRIGYINNIPVIVLKGRSHVYENNNINAMTEVIKTVSCLGCDTLIQTSSVGSLQPWIRVGDIVNIKDHINFPQMTPHVVDEISARFLNMSHPYEECDIDMWSVTYAWVLGPQFETPAEARMLRIMGADIVGMSIVPETIIAKYLNMKVHALGLVVNTAAETSSHEQTLKVAADSSAEMSEIIEQIVQDIST